MGIRDQLRNHCSVPELTGLCKAVANVEERRAKAASAFLECDEIETTPTRAWSHFYWFLIGFVALVPGLVG